MTQEDGGSVRGVVALCWSKKAPCWWSNGNVLEMNLSPWGRADRSQGKCLEEQGQEQPGGLPGGNSIVLDHNKDKGFQQKRHPRTTFPSLLPYLTGSLLTSASHTVQGHLPREAQPSVS